MRCPIHIFSLATRPLHRSSGDDRQDVDQRLVLARYKLRRFRCSIVYLMYCVACSGVCFLILLWYTIKYWVYRDWRRIISRRHAFLSPHPWSEFYLEEGLEATASSSLVVETLLAVWICARCNLGLFIRLSPSEHLCELCVSSFCVISVAYAIALMSTFDGHMMQESSGYPATTFFCTTPLEHHPEEGRVSEADIFASALSHSPKGVGRGGSTSSPVSGASTTTTTATIGTTSTAISSGSVVAADGDTGNYRALSSGLGGAFGCYMSSILVATDEYWLLEAIVLGIRILLIPSRLLLHLRRLRRVYRTRSNIAASPIQFSLAGTPQATTPRDGADDIVTLQDLRLEWCDQWHPEDVQGQPPPDAAGAHTVVGKCVEPFDTGIGDP